MDGEAIRADVGPDALHSAPAVEDTLQPALPVREPELTCAPLRQPQGANQLETRPGRGRLGSGAPVGKAPLARKRKGRRGSGGGGGGTPEPWRHPVAMLPSYASPVGYCITPAQGWTHQAAILFHRTGPPLIHAFLLHYPSVHTAVKPPACLAVHSPPRPTGGERVRPFHRHDCMVRGG